MKTLPVSLITVVSAIALSSCADMGPNTQSGAATGGLVGAAAGGIIGHQSGRALEGAAIGAGAGALTGGAIGSSRDEQNRRRYQGGY